MGQHFYLFLDEAGNLDFSAKGTRFFMFGGVLKQRPFYAYRDLIELRYDLVEQGMDLPRFHASEDRQEVRNQVFQVIERHLAGVSIQALVVEKRKTTPALQAEDRFYPRMLGNFIKQVISTIPFVEDSRLLIFTDRLPAGRRQRFFEAAIRTAIAEVLTDVTYQILHHDSASSMDLQIADYCTWAIYRKWDRGDERSYRLIKPAISKEFEIFRAGTTYFY